MTAEQQGGQAGPGKRGPVSRIYEVMGIDDGGDVRVRQAVRRVIEQLIRFISHYSAALKRQARSEKVAEDAAVRRAPGARE